MKKESAGILVYRMNNGLEVLLVHPGGPFFKNREVGAWSIPKGEFSGEDPLTCARREFEEETGSTINGNFIELHPVIQKGGKKVYCWAVEGNINENQIVSNTFLLEWPPKSGKFQNFPEIDRASWFTIVDAKERINPSQFNFIEQLIGRFESAATR